jgi:ATP-dependent helicase Lhr and Lhr-like helicase
VSNFDSLHPAIQHHIVNSLGWSELRPFQEAAIPHVLSGKHAIILAPTAGGKTECVVFPVLSRMLSEPWEGLSVLYICPIKALINDLATRLERYTSLVGRRSSLWHGDIGRSKRTRMIEEPPDVLLSTPESLEVMFTSSRIDALELLGNVQVVVIDEIHAFAGDDRGWHLLALLSRLNHLAGREFQRLGLSATVGNPEFLAEWLAGGSDSEPVVLLPEYEATTQADVKIDYVGSLDNAAHVISRMFRGEKRLVFVDSRARAEQLADALRRLDVRTFVTHSSLSRDERGRAENAFHTGEDCVIVATSVLELGVDVGDLDRVIQIDSPPTVSSFLQRMGRTGRRAESRRNCLFLATRDHMLLRAASIIQLSDGGYVEPVNPPLKPYHILAQQLLALALQENGIGKRTWFEWIDGVSAFVAMDRGEIDALVAWMIEHEILFEDQGILGIGRGGEHSYGRKNFLELLSVFMSPPFFTILHGRNELGYVDERAFLEKDRGNSRVVLLGGRAWSVQHIDWQHHQVFVQPTEVEGGAWWPGDASGLSFRLCQTLKDIMGSGEASPSWSRRAVKQIDAIRTELPWIESGPGTFLVSHKTSIEWWTFAGARANAAISSGLQREFTERVKHDDLRIILPDAVFVSQVENAISKLTDRSPAEILPTVDEDAIKGLKFADILPLEMSLRVLQSKLADPSAVEQILNQSIRIIVA